MKMMISVFFLLSVLSAAAIGEEKVLLDKDTSLGFYGGPNSPYAATKRSAELLCHTYHHLYTLHPRGDREVTLPKDPSLKFFYLLQLFTVNITGGFESAGIIPTIGGTIKPAFTGKFAGAVGVHGHLL